MATARQIEANRANSQKSTGPRTDEGKAKSSLNHLSHGFASSATVMPGEDPQEFIALHNDLAAEHQSATPTEQILLEKMVVTHWLSLRAYRLQGEAFLKQHMSGDEFGVPKSLGVLIRYHSTFERAFHKAHNELVKAKKQRSNSEIGFEPQNASADPAETPADPPKSASATPEMVDFAYPEQILTEEEALEEQQFLAEYAKYLKDAA